MFRNTLIMMLAVLTSPLVAGKYNPVLDIGDKAPVWKQLPGVDGKTHSLIDLKKKELIVVVFTCNTCPYAVDVENRLIEFAKEYSNKKVGLVAINVNKVRGDRFEDMKNHAAKNNFNFPYLFDETQKIARDYGATYTPEFFVLNKDRKIAYMGALDDSPDGTKITKRYVRSAVDALLNGDKPPVEETIAIGCGVRYERKRRKRK